MPASASWRSPRPTDATKYAATSTCSGKRSRDMTLSSTGIGDRKASASSAGPRPASVSMAGWMPRESSCSSFDGLAQSRRDTRELVPNLGALRRWLRRCGARREREGDESLLCPVVKVALDLTPCFVGSCDETLPGGCKLGSVVRVRDRRCDELDEARQALIDVRWQWVGRVQRHRTPEAAVNDHGASDLIDEAELPHRVRDGAVRRVQFFLVPSCRAPGAQHPG